MTALLVLDATTKTISVVLAAAKVTTDPTYSVHFGDATTSTFIEGALDGVLNGTSAVSVLPSPGASTRRVLKEMTIYNADTVAITAIISLLNSSGPTSREIRKVDIAVGATFSLSDPSDAIFSHTQLTAIGTNTHAQVDTHISASANVHGLPASVNVLGNRSAAGEFVQRGSTAVTTTSGAAFSPRYGTAVVTFAVAFNTITAVLVGASTQAVTNLSGGYGVTTSGFNLARASDQPSQVGTCGWLAIGT